MQNATFHNEKSKTSICSGVEVDVDIYSASFLTAAASFFQASRFNFFSYLNSWTLIHSRLNFSSEQCCSFDAVNALYYRYRRLCLSFSNQRPF